MNVVVIGVGRRIREWYDPILSLLEKEQKIRITGCFNRTKSKAEQFVKKHQTVSYSSVEELINQQKKQTLAIISVPGKFRIKHALSCMQKGIHVFIESPAAYSKREALQLAKAAKTYGVVCEVAEDKAAYMENRLHQKIISTKKTGDIIAIYNDQYAYAYHGLARAHMLISQKPFAWHAQKHSIGNYYQNTKTVQFGRMLYQERFLEPKNTLGLKGTWTIVCEHALLTNECIVLNNKEYPVVITPTKITACGVSIPLHKDLKGNKDQSLYFLLDATLQAIHNSKDPYYGIRKSIQDIWLWKSLQLHAAGAPKPLVPLIHHLLSYK